MTNDEKIEQIQQELKQLSQKHLELERAHQQRVKSHEEQKTLYRHLFGQPPVQPDPELQSVKEEIARLEKDKDNYFKIIQAAASIPPPVLKKDWTKSPFYSHTLRSWNYDYPPDQMGFYVTTLTGIGIVSKAFWRSWNIKKAAEIFKQGVESAEPGKFDFHMHNSGVASEKNLVRAMASRGYKTGKAVAVAGLLVTGFAVFVQLKNKNRFNK